MEFILERALELACTSLSLLVGVYWRAQEKRNTEVEERLRTIELLTARLEERLKTYAISRSTH